MYVSEALLDEGFCFPFLFQSTHRIGDLCWKRFRLLPLFVVSCESFTQLLGVSRFWAVFVAEVQQCLNLISQASCSGRGAARFSIRAGSSCSSNLAIGVFCACFAVFSCSCFAAFRTLVEAGLLRCRHAVLEAQFPSSCVPHPHMCVFGPHLHTSDATVHSVRRWKKGDPWCRASNSRGSASLRVRRAAALSRGFVSWWHLAVPCFKAKLDQL